MTLCISLSWVLVPPAPSHAGTNQDVTSETGAQTIATADNWDMTLQAVSPPPNPATTSFVVPRWGGSGLVAYVQGTKLVLPVDLSQAVCRTADSTPVPCGAGKYLVTSVTALPWHDSILYDVEDTAKGTKPSGAYTQYTFIGEWPVCSGGGSQ